MDKINAVALIKGFHKLVGQPPPPIRLQIDHSVQVTKPAPRHTLNANVTHVELLQALRKVQRNKVASLYGMKTKIHFGCERVATHVIIDSVQLLFDGGLSRSPFHWGGPRNF